MSAVVARLVDISREYRAAVDTKPGRIPFAKVDAMRARGHLYLVEIVAMISLFGWLNRWNDTMATDLEDEPVEFASKHLAHQGWETGKHRA